MKRVDRCAGVRQTFLPTNSGRRYGAHYSKTQLISQVYTQVFYSGIALNSTLAALAMLCTALGNRQSQTIRFPSEYRRGFQ